MRHKTELTVCSSERVTSEVVQSRSIHFFQWRCKQSLSYREHQLVTDGHTHTVPSHIPRYAALNMRRAVKIAQFGFGIQYLAFCCQHRNVESGLLGDYYMLISSSLVRCKFKFRLPCCQPATFVPDIAVFVLKRDIKLQPTNQPVCEYLLITFRCSSAVTVANGRRDRIR